MKKRLILQISKIILMLSTLSFCTLIILFCVSTFNIEETIPNIYNIELYDKDDNKFRVHYLFLFFPRNINASHITITTNSFTRIDTCRKSVLFQKFNYLTKNGFTNRAVRIIFDRD